MRSATSCFNSTLYAKTMARFWPLWALHGLIWLFVMPLRLVNRYFDYLGDPQGVSRAQEYLMRWMKDIPEMLEPGVLLALVAGVLCAMAVFGYLYNHRSASMMHALPMRREALFTTQYLAGLSFLLLPLLAVALITVVVAITLLPSGNWGEAIGYILTWLLAQSGTSLFFYSFASFCAMFTGHILALPAFYAILNALAYVLHFLISALMASLFYGVYYRSGGSDLVRYLTPFWTLTEACHISATYTAPDGAYSMSAQTMAAPGTVAAYAVAGVVLTLLALLVYRCRHVESAGDVVSIPIVRPFFQWGVAFCSGLCFGVYTVAFFGWDLASSLTASVLVWTVVGFFVAEMLLKKSFRVLRAWKRCLLAVAAMAVLCAACAFDWFGVEDRVPKAEDVASVEIHSYMSYPWDEAHNFALTFTDQGNIQRMINLHKIILQDRHRADPDPSDGQEYGDPRYGDEYLNIELIYTLDNGSTLARSYSTVPLFLEELEQEGSVTWQVDQLVQDRALVEQCYNFDFYQQYRLAEARLDNLRYVGTGQYTNAYLDGYARELWQAVRADFEEGTIGVRYLFDTNERRANTYETDLVFTFDKLSPTDEDEVESAKSYRIYSLTITLTPNARHTLAVLAEAGIPGKVYEFSLHEPSPKIY